MESKNNEELGRKLDNESLEEVSGGILSSMQGQECIAEAPRIESPSQTKPPTAGEQTVGVFGVFATEGDGTSAMLMQPGSPEATLDK